MYNNARYLIIDTKRKLRLMQSKAMHIMAGILVCLYGLQHIMHPHQDVFISYTILILGLSFIILPIVKSKLFSELHLIRSFRILEAGLLGMGGMFYLKQGNTSASIIFIFLALAILGLLWFELRLFSDRYITIDPKGASIEYPLRTLRISSQDIEQVALNNNVLAISKSDGTIHQYDVEPLNEH